MAEIQPIFWAYSRACTTGSGGGSHRSDFPGTLLASGLHFRYLAQSQELFHQSLNHTTYTMHELLSISRIFFESVVNTVPRSETAEILPVIYDGGRSNSYKDLNSKVIILRQSLSLMLCR